MRRSGPLKRSGGLKRTGFKRRAYARRWPVDEQLAAVWFKAVTRDAKGKPKPCVVCGRRDRRVQGHHVLDQQIIKDYALGQRLTNDECQALLWDEDNGVPICPEPCHEQHTSAFRRIPYARLPVKALVFADRLGLLQRLDPPRYGVA